MKRTPVLLILLLTALNVSADPYDKADPFRTDGALQPTGSDGTQGEDDGLAWRPLIGWPVFVLGFQYTWWFEFTRQTTFDSGRPLLGDQSLHFLNDQPFTTMEDAPKSTMGLVNFSQGGTVDVDWRRYRNLAWNYFIAAPSFESERSFPAHKYVNFEVWGHRGGVRYPLVSDSHRALVSIRYYYKPGCCSISLPVIEFDAGVNFNKIDHVKIWVHTPTGDSHVTRLNISQPALPITPPRLPYPAEPTPPPPPPAPPPCRTCYEP